jgi:hypothetical protein
MSRTGTITRAETRIPDPAPLDVDMSGRYFAR